MDAIARYHDLLNDEQLASDSQGMLDEQLLGVSAANAEPLVKALTRRHAKRFSNPPPA